jgi:S-formylglutathione hydrolase
MTTTLTVRSEHAAFGGRQGFYERLSEACGGPMRFSVYLPPAALRGERVPAVYYLAGLTCTEEHLPTKGGALQLAAELGLALVACDTSPRAARFPGDDASWDFGQGAGFYLDATEAPWSAAYRMETHVVRELPAWVEEAFPLRTDVRGIFGHSMGGHGALTLALRHPDRYASVSAFAPIVAPSRVPWGEKAFTGYLGAERATWAEHDASCSSAESPTRRRSSSTRACPTSSSSASCAPSCSRRRAPRRARRSRCAATRATTTRTTSSPRSWATTSATITRH